MLELKASKLRGFSKKTAKELINKTAEAYKHYWKWCEREGISKGFCSKGYAKENYDGKVARLETEEGQRHALTIYQEVKKALKEGRLLLSCLGGLSWNVKTIENNQIRGIGLVYMKALCGYPMNYNKMAYTMGCYGTSRPNEIIQNYGSALGLKFKQIRQDQQLIY